MPHIRMLARVAAAGFAALSGIASAAAQAPDPARARHMPARVFTFPFTADWNDRNIKQLKLYVSGNNGQAWDLHATASPGQRSFDVRLERDGTYAFGIQTFFANGKVTPEAVSDLKPAQFVVVDTEKPFMVLQSLSPRQLEAQVAAVGVRWEVRDDHLDPRSIRLEVRAAGQGPWIPITDKPIGPQGEDVRSVRTSQRLEYRLIARDLAGNESVQGVMVGVGVSPNSPINSAIGGTGLSGMTTGRTAPRPGLRLVNRNDIVLEFRINEKGPSGIADYELFTTTGRGDWQKVDRAKFQTSANDPDKGTVTHHVSSEGTYGFTIIARSKANLAMPEPKGNDDPQIWVEVDTKPPEAKIMSAQFAAPNDPRSLVIAWSASDKNLDASSIILEYSEKGDGDWKELTAPTGNSGKLTVATPQVAGYQFFIRLRAIDRAGNQTIHTFEKPIIVDVVRPNVEIIDVNVLPKP